MKFVKVDKLKANEVIAVPVLSSSDTILMQSDTILKDEYISKLMELNIDGVYIKNENQYENSIQIQEYKVEETKTKSKEIVKSILERHIYKRSDDLKKIGEAAENILDSVISEPQVIRNITEIRNISTDMYTHCINVCSLSTIMAFRLKMSEKQIKNVAMGAMLHDIGLRYIAVPYNNIRMADMNSKDALEYKKHTVFGYSSLQQEEWLSDTVKEIILFHHERIDGSGYPFQQNGDKIKAEVKLVAVCDDFDSLISGIGNEKMKIYEAIEYIKVCAGTVYDASVTHKLLESIALYPVGIQVVTSEGEIGIVVRQNADVTDRPVLRMCRHSDGSEYTDEVEKDLMKILTLFIVDTVE